MSTGKLLINTSQNLSNPAAISQQTSKLQISSAARKGEQIMTKNTICLWYEKDAEAAAHFYAKTFPDSAVIAVHHARATIREAKKAMY